MQVSHGGIHVFLRGEGLVAYGIMTASAFLQAHGA